jgi:hypothetical protein
VEWADSWVNGQFMWLRSDRLPRLILQLDFFFLEKTGHKKKRDSCARLNWCTETSKRATFPLIVHAASVYELSRCRLAYPLLDWRVIQRLKSSIWNNIFKAYPSFWSTFYSTWKNILKVSQRFWSTFLFYVKHFQNDAIPDYCHALLFCRLGLAMVAIGRQ